LVGFCPAGCGEGIPTGSRLFNHKQTNKQTN
jgi:hypothetical protein